MSFLSKDVLPWVPLIAAVIAFVSAVTGIILGAYLTRSWQRKQWLLESKKAEYRELISCLSQSAHFILNNSPHLMGPSGMGALKSGEQERQSDEAIDRGHTVIADRIVISDVMGRENVCELLGCDCETARHK